MAEEEEETQTKKQLRLAAAALSVPPFRLNAIRPAGDARSHLRRTGPPGGQRRSPCRQTLTI